MAKKESENPDFKFQIEIGEESSELIDKLEEIMKTNFPKMEFEDLQSHIIVKSNGVEIKGYWREDLANLFEIDTVEFDSMVERSQKLAKNHGLARALSASLHGEFNMVTVSASGVYIILYLSTEIKRYSGLKVYLEYFKNLAFDDLLSYFAKNESKGKTKRASNLPEEFRIQSDDDIALLLGKKVDAHLRIPDMESVTDTSHKLYGKKIVITGNFTRWNKREDIVKLVTSVGGRVMTSVNKSIDLVIVGTEAGPAKLKQISELNIEAIDQEEFVSLF